MKKQITLSVIVAVLAFFATSLNAQQSFNLNMDVVTVGKINKTDILPGTHMTVKSIMCDVSSRRGFNYIMTAETPEGDKLSFDLSKVKEMPIVCENPTKDEFWYSRSIRYSLPSLSHMSNAYAARNKAEEDANKYVMNLREQGLIIEDPMLTSYINSLLTKISPSQRLDNFKYNVKAVIVKSPELNAAMYPNGVLMINAGMLANLHTEDELVALLCHEVNHFVCNHYLENLQKTQRRQAIGAIGGILLGAATGILLGSPSLGLSAASMGVGIAGDLNAMYTALGLAFDQTQEIESDRAAVELLPILGYDENAMATCIKRIGDSYLEEGNLDAYYTSGNHQKIEDRIATTGTPYDRTDEVFEKKMATCISYLAQVSFAQGRYDVTINLAKRNINNGIARGLDFYMLGECLLAAYDTEDTNAAAAVALENALNSNCRERIPAMKALIIAYIRTGRIEEATTQLKQLKDTEGCSEDDLTWADNIMMTI
ncbi:MAG: M48 family metalloprotease [Bacteroidales bacterium]|nr:M48 family metalloprotease [Bacteroidales bacterium]